MLGENIKKYRLLRGLSLREFGEKVGLTQTSILKYENNQLKPDGEKLIKFAEILNCTVLDLLKDQSKRQALNLNFRKRKHLAGKKLEQLKVVINDKINNYLDVLELSGINKTHINKLKVSSLEDAEKCAEKFRKDYNIGSKLPIANLCNIIEDIGISVIIIDDKNGNFVGFDGVSDTVEGYPFVCISSDINYYRQRFTLAHELGHLVLDIDKTLDEEKVCNYFASSLLMPKQAMQDEFGYKRYRVSPRELEIVREEYGVSIKAILMRIITCEIIGDSFAKLSFINYNKNIKADEEEKAKKYKEFSRRYEQLAWRLYDQEIITRSKLNELVEGLSTNG